MAELKTVLDGLRQCMMASNRNEFETQCMDCPYFNPEVTVEECMEPLREDAFVLLKAQQGKIEQMGQEIERLKAQKSVEPKTGHWICGKYDDLFMCSSCEKYSMDDYPFCHWCGAKMKQEGR